MKEIKSNTPTVRYHILKSGNGIVVGGHIVRSNLSANLTLEFLGAPNEARLVLNAEDKSYYRTIVDGKAALPVAYLDGKITLAVSTADSIIPCEALYAVKTENEVVLLVYDVHAEKKSREAMMLCDELTMRLDALNTKTKNISSKLSELMEYWDVI